MRVSNHVSQSARLQGIVMAGTLFFLLMLLVTGAFVVYRNALVETLKKKQALYSDLMELRKISCPQGEGGPPGELIERNLQFTLGKVFERAEAADEHTISEILRRNSKGVQIVSAPDRKQFLLALDRSIHTADISIHRVLDLYVMTSNIFVLTMIVFVTLLLAFSWMEFHRNYARALIPLARLAEKIGTINNCIPESIHAAAEEIRNDPEMSLHTPEISRITNTMVGICRDIQVKNKKLDELHIRDEKTNLYNYRHFKEHLIMEIERAKQLEEVVSIAMVDIDHFKRYNDEHGHVAGDQVLEQLAEIISTQCRSRDMPSRFGGEEFALLFPRTTPETALRIADRLRQIICAEPIAHEKRQPEGRLTVSIGIAAFPDDAPDWYSLINNADRALYHAKATGRNRVCLFSSIRSDEESA